MALICRLLGIAVPQTIETGNGGES
jgi:hypothetical protein